MRSNRDQNIRFCRREKFIKHDPWDWGGLCSKKPELREGFQKTFLKAKREWERRGWLLQFLVQESFVLAAYPPTSGQDVPVNLQQGNVTLCSAPCLSLYDRTLEGQGFKNGLAVYFRL